MLHLNRAHICIAKDGINQKGTGQQKLKQIGESTPLHCCCRSEGEFSVVLCSSEALHEWIEVISHHPCGGPGASESFLLDCPPCHWLLANLLPSQSACMGCTYAKPGCQGRCRWQEWPGNRSQELHTRQLLPIYSMQYVLSKPTAHSNMPRCRTAAVRGSKCTMHNCAQQQSGLQQCLQLPATFNPKPRTWLSHCSPWTDAQKEGRGLWLSGMYHLIACLSLWATCHMSWQLLELKRFISMRLVACSSLTKHGAGKKLWVHPPCQ